MLWVTHGCTATKELKGQTGGGNPSVNGERKGELCLSLSSLLTRQGKCQRDRNELVLHLDEAASEFKDFFKYSVVFYFASAWFFP